MAVNGSLGASTSLASEDAHSDIAGLVVFAEDYRNRWPELCSFSYWNKSTPQPDALFMTFEHFALNVSDARVMSRWYVEHLGFTIARSREDAPHTHFLADGAGRIVVELYTNPVATITDFATAHPLSFHFAVVTSAARNECARLEKAGAKFFLEDALPDGSVLIMMRDPWGVPLQLCQRATPFPGYETFG
jgi:glyoxylase I family protein